MRKWKTGDVLYYAWGNPSKYLLVQEDKCYWLPSSLGSPSCNPKNCNCGAERIFNKDKEPDRYLELILSGKIVA